MYFIEAYERGQASNDRLIIAKLVDAVGMKPAAAFVCLTHIDNSDVTNIMMDDGEPVITDQGPCVVFTATRIKETVTKVRVNPRKVITRSTTSIEAANIIIYVYHN